MPATAELLDVPRLESIPLAHVPPATRRLDRRQHRRLTPDEFQWLLAARVKYGPAVRVLDISAGGMLVELPKEVKSDSRMVFELSGPDSTILVPSRVVRCLPSRARNVTSYRGACAFTRPLALDQLAPGAVEVDEEREPAPRLLTSDDEPEAAAGGDTDTGSAVATWQKVIVRYRDGMIVRGYTNTFHPSRPQLYISDEPSARSALLVPLAQLKAVFFVREFGGDPTYVESKTFVARPQGRKIAVTFEDGEVLIGSTLAYHSEGYGFFVHPADAASNNLRVFVALPAVKHARFLPA